MKEDEVADIIFGEDATGDRFGIKWGILKIRLKIKPVSTRTLIKISREVAHIKEFDLNNGTLSEQLAHADSFKHICRSIAIATDTKFPRLVSKAVSELPFQDVKKLWMLVAKNCDPSSFFFTMALTKGYKKLTTTVPGRQWEERQSSAESPQ